MRAAPLNPVLARELKQRMRERRPWVLLTIYLLILSGVLYVVYEGASNESVNSGFGAPGAVAAASVGRSMFQTLLFFILVLVCIIVPGQTAAAIAGERERQTLVPLQVTMLRPVQIVTGKLLSSLAFVALLVIAALPLVGVSFLMGGVTVGEAVRGIGMALAWAVTLASLALLCSSLVRRTQGATMAAYGIAFFLVLGTFVIYGAQRVIVEDNGSATSQSVLIPNPFMATADVVDAQNGEFQLLPSPFEPLQDLIRDRVFTSNQMVEIEGRPRAVVPAPAGFQPVREADDPHGSFWPKSLVAFVVLSAASVALAARRLRTPGPGDGG